MKPYIIKNKEFLQFFCKLSPSKQFKLVPLLSTDQIQTISEICKNFLQFNLTQNPQIIKKVKHAKKAIKDIALKKTPLHKKRDILKSRKGGAIFSVLLPLAASVITSLLSK